jgi:O-antigen/teichoic acid export membrane protein
VLKKLVKFSASYTVIEGLQRGILFLLLPIFTHYMSPEEYGVVSTSLILISFLSILFSFAIHAAISRYYFKYEKKSEELKLFLGSNFLFLLLFSLSVSIFLIFFSENIFSYFFAEMKFNPYIIYTLIIVATQVVIVAYFSLLKAMQKLKLYSIVFNGYFLFQLMLMSILIIGYGLKEEGYLLGVLISNILFIPIIFILLNNYIVYKIDMKYIKEALAYSIPIVPVEIIGNVNRLVDRYYILLFIGLGGVGIYYIGVQIAGLINLVALAINSAYTPMFFKKYECTDNEDYDDIYALTDIIVFVIGAIASLIIVLSPLLLMLFSKEYAQSIDVVLYLGFTGAITSVYFVNTNVLSLEPKLIKLKTVGIMFGAAVNVILGYFFTRYYGIEGAALSTLIGFFITTIILIVIVRKNSEFRFNNFKYLLYLGILFIVLFAIKSMLIINQVLLICSVLVLLFISSFKLSRGKNGVSIRSRI